MNFDKLDALKRRLDGFRPLGPEAARNLHDDLVVRWTYNSNAIEGNTLTLKETKVALEGITIGGKTMREHFEAINHREAIFYVEDLVGKNEALSEWQIESSTNGMELPRSAHMDQNNKNQENTGLLLFATSLVKRMPHMEATYFLLS